MGRGKSTPRSKSSSGNNTIPKMNNPAGIPSNHMTEDEFLMLRGFGDVASGIGIDRYAGANMNSFTNKQRQKTLSDMKAQNDIYYDNRTKARAEYQKLVLQGKIVPKTPIEITITNAHGNPDLESTQSARRMALKRGYDWRTGKKIKR